MPHRLTMHRNFAPARTRLELLLCSALALGLVGPAGCKKGAAPEIAPIADQVAVVGQQLTIDVFASDPDGDSIDFSFEAAALPDLESTTSLTIAPDGHAVFKLTPLASQIGTQFVDFIASDGNNKDKLTIVVEIKGAAGSGTLPIFRKPLGSGTVLDLEQSECVDVPIEIEDADSTSVTLGAQPPIIEASELSAASDGLSGTWSWCPTRGQIEGDDRYDLVLAADDGENPPTIKDYVIVLRKRQGADCPGEPPVVEHTPMDYSTLLDLEVTAHITDDQGLKNAPILLYGTADPGDPVDFAQLTLADMELVDGDMVDGTWTGFIPNPTANEGEGATSPIYYLISVSDNDDTEGDCDHLTDHPRDGTHQVTVTNNGMGSAGVCASCSADIQCGDPDDLCLTLQSGKNRCGKSCSGDGDCDSGYICSPQAVESVDDASGRQCIPNSGSCSGGGGMCEDDAAEDDDNPTQAAALGAFGPDNELNAKLCPDDDDWYLLETSAEGKIDATLSGDTPPDMDLALTDQDGVLIKQSVGLMSTENLVSPCLPSGTYFLRVFSTSADEGGDYSIQYTLDGCGSGGGVGDCCADNNSPGCEDPQIESCVCAMDSFCCDFEWDNTCAMVAQDSCDACTGMQNEDCCTVQMSPGCTDMTIQDCVCAQDSFCCSTAWDQFCVNKVGTTLCAPACNPDDADGPCCSENGSPGCEINSVEMCVCEQDMFCCTNDWDSLCVGLIATHDCGTCPG